MRISDWSSDVCSSDLLSRPPEAREVPRALARRHRASGSRAGGRRGRGWRGGGRPAVAREKKGRIRGSALQVRLQGKKQLRRTSAGSRQDGRRPWGTEERRGGKEGGSTCRYRRSQSQ